MSDHNIAIRRPSSGSAQQKALPASRALAAPLLVLGLEWGVSASNKFLGHFVDGFPSYIHGLLQSNVFLPGLRLIGRFPIAAAYAAEATEAVMAILLIAAAFALWRGIDRVGVPLAEATSALSAVVSTMLWLMLGHQPFWPTAAINNGFGAGIRHRVFPCIAIGGAGG